MSGDLSAFLPADGGFRYSTVALAKPFFYLYRCPTFRQWGSGPGPHFVSAPAEEFIRFMSAPIVPATAGHLRTVPPDLTSLPPAICLSSPLPTTTHSICSSISIPSACPRSSASAVSVPGYDDKSRDHSNKSVSRKGQFWVAMVKCHYSQCMCIRQQKLS